MLPYFKIFNTNNTKDQMPQQQQQAEQPQKPKRNKKVVSASTTVPIHHHRGGNNEETTTHRQFGANFTGKRNNKCIEDVTQPDCFDPQQQHNRSSSKRHLVKENERLAYERSELGNTNEHLTKKNCKLKEKLQQLMQTNEEIVNENNALRLQLDEAVNRYNALRNEFETPKVCQDCIETSDVLNESKRDYVALRKVNQEMLEDCNMLKNVVYRLNVQLERYQQKQSDVSDVELGDGHGGHLHTPISWGKVNVHTLGPLLNAYQETINEKEHIIEEYQAEMSKFTCTLKEVLKENENLYRKLNEDDECSKVLAEQLENVRLELKSCKEQNDLLIKKCALKQDKLEEVLKCYETKVEQLKRDYNVLHEQYTKSRVEAVGLKEKNKSLIDAQDDFRNERQQFIPISVHNASVNECKKWYEELKIQYESEKHKLQDVIDELRTEIKAMEAKMNALSNERSDFEGKLKNSEKTLKKMESKYLEMEHNMHEVQLSRSACRKQLHKAMNFAKDLVGEQEALLKALNQRQQENKAVKRIGTDIASRMDILRNQLKTVQKEAWQELSTVEERIQEQDSIITTMKEEHQQEIVRLKQIIREKEVHS